MYLATCTQIYCVLGSMQITCPHFLVTYQFVVCWEALVIGEVQCSGGKGVKTRLYGKSLYE